MNSMDHRATRFAAIAALLAGALPAVAQAQSAWAGCQQAVQGEVWSTAPCLTTSHFTLLRTDNYGYNSSAPSALTIEQVDDSSISLLGAAGYTSNVGPYYGAGYSGGVVNNSTQVGPIIEGVAAGNYGFVDHTLSADTTVTSWSYSAGRPGSLETKPETQTVSFAVSSVPLESFASLAAYRQSVGTPYRGPFTSYGRDQYSQGPNGTSASDFGSSNAITAFRLTATVQAVPEPSSWALMGLGLLGMAASVRRQRR